MGGFVIDTNSNDPFIPSCPRLIVTARGIQLLAECGYIPQITRREITDKSKSDTPAKLLCCLQVGWMVLQILLRFYLRLPVTRLEVHTLAHIFCAILMFVLSWNKPRWIMEPTRLEGQHIHELCAFMYMLSPISSRKLTSRRTWNRFVSEAEMSELTFVSRDQAPERLPGAGSGADSSNHTRGIFLSSSALETTTAERPSWSQNSAQVQDAAVREIERRRWDLAASAISLYPRLADRTRRNRDEKKTVASEVVTDHACNWPAGDLLRGKSDWSIGITLWLVSLLHGAIHTCGWTSFFPSSVDIWLWKIATIYLVFSGFLWSWLSCVRQMAPGLLWSWGDMLNGRSH